MTKKMFVFVCERDQKVDFCFFARALFSAGAGTPRPLSQSRPKRAAAEATGEKILSSLKEERAAPGERDSAAASATTMQPVRRQKRAVPSSVVKVEAQKEEAAAAASRRVAGQLRASSGSRR